MIKRTSLVRDWHPRYTGTPLTKFGSYVLLTNFDSYVREFAERYQSEVFGEGRPMQASTNRNGVTIVNFGIGTANVATIIDLLGAISPKGVLFLGKCGGLKKSTEIGHFIIPNAAIRGEGTSDDYFPPQVPALPSFKLHKFVSEKLREGGLDFRTGVVYTANRRVWEHDESFRNKLHGMSCIGIDMETATFFIVGHYNQIPRGALLLVSDVPISRDGIKTQESDRAVSDEWTAKHLELGASSMAQIGKRGEKIKHFSY